MNAFFIPEDEVCPYCNSNNLVKNGHVHKIVKHCVYSSSLITVKCNFQNYKCKNCNSIFQEKNAFSPNNISFSYESIYEILDALKYANASFESVASTFHITRQNVIDLFDRFFTYTPSSTLPTILSFDEKHIGKAISDHKYLFIILDWVNKKIYDILDSRDKNTLWKYFSSISKEQRDKVLYVTMDMWSTYRDIVKHFFKKC